MSRAFEFETLDSVFILNHGSVSFRIWARSRTSSVVLSPLYYPLHRDAMVYYIRFLKTPQVSRKRPSSVTITTLVTITSDLGDTFLTTDENVIGRLIDANNETIVFSETSAQWRARSRILSLKFDVPIRPSQTALRMHVTTETTLKAIEMAIMPTIIDVWSYSFGQEDGTRAALVVERRLWLAADECVQIWEETGDSIARHIWDAALGTLACLEQTASDSRDDAPLPILQELLGEAGMPEMNVIELGAGCGIVGIALAQIFPNVRVLLTDLEDGQEMLEMNMKVARTTHGSSLRNTILDWESPRVRRQIPPKAGLVIVSDCTYNADSSPALCKVLAEIASVSPDVKVLLSMKRRHESEAVFFDLIKKAGFRLLEGCSAALPFVDSEQDPETGAGPRVELFLYGITSRM